MKNRIPANNSMAIQTIRRIAGNQVDIYKATGRFAPAEVIIPKLDLENARPDALEKHGYRIELECSEKSFKIWLYPSEYGNTGLVSYFFDSRVGKIQGADHKGAKASENDPPLSNIADEDLKTLQDANPKSN